MNASQQSPPPSTLACVSVSLDKDLTHLDAAGLRKHLPQRLS